MWQKCGNNTKLRIFNCLILLLVKYNVIFHFSLKLTKRQIYEYDMADALLCMMSHSERVISSIFPLLKIISVHHLAQCSQYRVSICMDEKELLVSRVLPEEKVRTSANLTCKNWTVTCCPAIWLETDNRFHALLGFSIKSLKYQKGGYSPLFCVFKHGL